MNRAKAAAVLVALAAGAGSVLVAYNQAATNVGAAVAEVAAESQGEVIRAAARMRELGYSRASAVANIAAATDAPSVTQDSVRNLVAQRWSKNRPDARQRYQRFGLLVLLADKPAADAALSAEWCIPLTDPRDGTPGEGHAACVAANASLLTERWCDVNGTETHAGAQWSALPGDLPGLQSVAQGFGATVVSGADYDTVRAQYEAAAAGLGIHRCTAAELGLE